MGIRGRSGSWLVTLSVILGLLVWGSPAGASGPAITLKSKAQHPRARVAIHGAGFGATEKVDVSFDAIPTTTAITDDAGNFTGHFRVPAWATPGDHTVTALGEDSGLEGATTFGVTTDWRGFYFDVRNRSNAYENVLGVSNVSSLKELWSFKAAGAVDSSPAISNGVVYVGSDDGNLYALDASTGVEVWRYDTGGPVGSSPTLANGLVYVGSDSARVLALDASTGDKVWEFGTGGAVIASPTAANGLVYVGSFEDATFQALDASTGVPVWSFAAPASIYKAAAVARDMVLVPTALPEDGIHALDSSTGDELWRYVAPSYHVSSPIAANGLVYITVFDLGAIFALAPSNGRLIWRYDGYGGTIDTAPVVANGLVYTVSSQGYVDAVAADTGAPFWTTNLETCSLYFGSPAAANGVVYLDCGNQLHALDAMTGSVLWSYQGTATFNSSPAVVNGMVYVGSSDGVLHAFGLPSS
jgi:outer membrane protein assembly factor BamB